MRPGVACGESLTMLPLSVIARRLLVLRVLLAAVTALLVALPGVAWARAARQVGEPSRLEVSGHADAFYYRPHVRGQRPVLMYLHGRGGNPNEDCRKWAKVGTQFGWVVCPQGPEDRATARGAGRTAPTAAKRSWTRRSTR